MRSPPTFQRADLRPGPNGASRPPNNCLLRTLSGNERQLVLQGSTRHFLEAGATITEAGEPADALYFPESLIASVTDSCMASGSIEIGLIGREGAIGWGLLTGCPISPYRATVLGRGGSALRVEARALHEILRSAPSLRDHLLRFLHVFTVQMARTSLVSCCSSLIQRLCRWLLMFHDRVDGDDLDLNHNQIASVLGVRRASITGSLHILEGELLLRCTRAKIRIRDRELLERRAGDTYGSPEAQYRALVGAFGKGNWQAA